MPALGFLAVAGFTLIALLFLADATLEKSESPVIATSQRSGLPDSALHSEKTPILTAAPAPEPDMTLPAVRNAQPKQEPQEALKIHPAARAARAEAPLQNSYVAPPMHNQYPYRRGQAFDKFSIKGQ
jgi:hypothetical protein